MGTDPIAHQIVLQECQYDLGKVAGRAGQNHGFAIRGRYRLVHPGGGDDRNPHPHGFQDFVLLAGPLKEWRYKNLTPGIGLSDIGHPS